MIGLVPLGCQKGRARSEASGSASTGSAATSSAATSSGGPAAVVPANRDDTRFMKIRKLLSLDPESPERAVKLYGLVEPICSSPAERKDFVEVAKWSASFSRGPDTLPTVLALDTIEHVATSCFRNTPEAAFDLLEQAKAAVPDPHRYDLVTARLRAAAGELDQALVPARRAAAAGSIHAIALTANIEAQIARSQGAGYTPGMLDQAIKTVSVEPTGKWPLIDLTAVLTTRAHLLEERSVWEAPEPASASRKLAAEPFKRLSIAPFIGLTRSSALDTLCFDSVEIPDLGPQWCERAAHEIGNLGAAAVSKAPLDAKVLDLERLAKLEKLKADLSKLSARSTVLVVARGDESELITWARPASKVIARIAKRGAKLVLVDRTKSPRASRLIERMTALAGATPVEHIRAPDTLAMPCLTAILAGRRTPKACPFDKKLEERLSKLPKFELALLIGRDLDAEIDDLKLYDLRAVLLSFRQPRVEKGLDVTLKSLSDVWILTAE